MISVPEPGDANIAMESPFDIQRNFLALAVHGFDAWLDVVRHTQMEVLGALSQLKGEAACPAALFWPGAIAWGLVPYKLGSTAADAWLREAHRWGLGMDPAICESALPVA